VPGRSPGGGGQHRREIGGDEPFSHGDELDVVDGDARVAQPLLHLAHGSTAARDLVERRAREGWVEPQADAGVADAGREPDQLWRWHIDHREVGNAQGRGALSQQHHDTFRGVSAASGGFCDR
jgi:hypothetical protein